LKKRASKRELLYITALVVAVALIAVGVYNAWRSFQRFDGSILAEKDTQFYSLMRSDDINIENSINSFVREAETFLSRDRLKNEIKAWKSGGDKSGLTEFIGNNTLKANPIYADLIVKKKDKIAVSAAGNTSYNFITGGDVNSMRLVQDDRGKYYLAYEYDGGGNISYDALIDIGSLYMTAVGTNPEREVMLIDSTSSVR